MVWPSFALETTGAAVMFAVMVTVNTLDKLQSTVIEEAANVTTDGLVWAAPSTVMTPDANRLSTELEPAVNFPMAALVTLRPVMLALVTAMLVAEKFVMFPLVPLMVVMVELVAVSVVVVMLVAVNWAIEPLAPRICEAPVVPIVVPVTVVMLALP